MAAVRNTHLLMAYSRLDARVYQLIVAVKQWAKLNNINTNPLVRLSSYSLTLMVVQYLQRECASLLHYVHVQSAHHPFCRHCTVWFRTFSSMATLRR
jgi:DNA polymerase sigma